MQLNLSPTFRVALYILTVIGTPAVVYLRAKDIIGDLELALWGAEVSAVTTLAALKVPAGEDERNENGISDYGFLVGGLVLIGVVWLVFFR